jgi:hypothetical protein
LTGFLFVLLHGLTFSHSNPAATNIITMAVASENWNHGRFFGASVMAALLAADELFAEDGGGSADNQGNDYIARKPLPLQDYTECPWRLNPLAAHFGW